MFKEFIHKINEMKGYRVFKKTDNLILSVE